MNDAKRNKIINFRVTDEEYAKLQDAALTRGTDPNDWCRDAALSSSRFKLTVNERVFYTEHRVVLKEEDSRIIEQTKTADPQLRVYLHN